MIDATGVPVIKLYRAYTTKAFKNKQYFGIGYCHAKKEHYYGQKLTLITNQEGIPVTYRLMPANKHDIKAIGQTTKKISSIWLVGDKGYISKRLKEKLYQKQRIRIITPLRKNQKQILNKWERKKLKHRQLIETINNQLKDHFQLEKLRAKSLEGIQTRVRNIIFTYLIAIYFL